MERRGVPPQPPYRPVQNGPGSSNGKTAQSSVPNRAIAPKIVTGTAAVANMTKPSINNAATSSSPIIKTISAMSRPRTLDAPVLLQPLRPQPKGPSEKLKKHPPNSINHSRNAAEPRLSVESNLSSTLDPMNRGNAKSPQIGSPVRGKGLGVNKDKTTALSPSSQAKQRSKGTSLGENLSMRLKNSLRPEDKAGSPGGMSQKTKNLEQAPVSRESDESGQKRKQDAVLPPHEESLPRNWIVENAFQRKAVVSDNTEIPPSTKDLPHEKQVTVRAFRDRFEVQSIVHKHLERLKTDHQSLLKIWLPRNRMREELHGFRKEINEQGKGFSGASRFPFTDLKSIEIKSNNKSAAAAKVTTEDTCFTDGPRSQPISYKKSWAVTKFALHGTQIPRYTSNSILGQNVLAENSKRLVVWPFLAWDDENENASEDLYPELKNRYTHGNPDDRQQLLARREKLKQTAPYLKSAMDEMGITIDDVLRYFLEDAGENLPSSEAEEVLQEDWEEDGSRKRQLKDGWMVTLSQLTPITDLRRKNAELLVEAYDMLERSSFWHVVKYLHSSRKRKLPTSTKSVRPLSTYAVLACRVCHLHDCDNHGEIKEKADVAKLNDEETSQLTSSDEDDPRTINHRVRVNARLKAISTGPQPMVYSLLAGSKTLSDPRVYAGRNSDGTVSGELNESALSKGTRPGFADDTLCSSSCFWEKSKRLETTSVADWTDKEYDVFESFLLAFGTQKRGPCMIAKLMNKPCIEVFVRMLVRSSEDAPIQQPEVVPERAKKGGFKKFLHKTIVHREPFVPCDHEDSCEEVKCNCFTQGIPCETSCRCPKDCERRFRGCSCARVGRICWQNRRCACFLHDRECDADLCGSCGADEVLDPRNKYNTDICKGRCMNVGIQRNVPKRMILGSSEVNGFGLFAGELVKKHEFIAEYKGEIVSAEESDRRAAIYDWRPANYLFKLNNNQDVDATYEGNKTRFINSASDDVNRNCEPALLLCKTVTRIGIYALRDIMPGEELFFDYRYPASKMEHFMEKTQENGETVLVKAKAAKPGQRRVRRKADAQSSLLSGLKQHVASDHNGDGDYKQMLNDYGVLQSDYDDDDEQFREETEAELKMILEREGNDDDDYEEERAWQSSSISDEGRAKHGRRVLRSRKTSTAMATTMSGTGAARPVKKEVKSTEPRGTKRPRSP